jgi:hypothetical protein
VVLPHCTKSWSVSSVCAVAVCTILGLGSIDASSARAGAFDWATGPAIEDETGKRDWSISVVPYLWLAGVTGSLTSPAAGTIPFDQTFQSLASNLVIGVEGVIDLRWRRWHVVSDGSWIEFSGQQVLSPATPGPLNPTINLGLQATEAFGTAGVAYELPLPWSTAVDVYLASRWWQFTTNVSAVGNDGSSRSGGSSTVWADAVAGVRLRHAITEHWKVSFGGDVGAGGSDLTWQLYGSLKYMINRHVGLGIGYRVLGVDYQDGSVLIDMTQRGLIMGIELAM